MTTKLLLSTKLKNEIKKIPGDYTFYLRNIKIILFDLIQGNGVPYLLSKDIASCFAKMTNENQITKKTSKTTKKIIFFKLLRFRITKSMNKRLQQYLQGKSQNPRRAHTLKHSNLYLLNTIWTAF